MKRITAKKIDDLISATFRHNHSGVQIDVLDIGKIFAAGRAAFAAGGEPAVGPAIAAVVATIRKN